MYESPPRATCQLMPYGERWGSVVTSSVYLTFASLRAVPILARVCVLVNQKMSAFTRPHWKGSGPVFFRSQVAAGNSGSVCQKCWNWSLEWRPPSPNTQAGNEALLKVDFYDIAESAELEECRYCYAMYHAILALGGRIGLHGYSLLTVSARRDRPFYVTFDDADEGRTCLELFRLEGRC
jgi:hypothetical protein